EELRRQSADLCGLVAVACDHAHHAALGTPRTLAVFACDAVPDNKSARHTNGPRFGISIGRLNIARSLSVRPCRSIIIAYLLALIVSSASLTISPVLASR